ncbi:MAG: hypothetical protein AAF433_04070 [Bacteroidota bacterium]
MRLSFTLLLIGCWSLALQAQDPSNIFHRTIDLREIQQFSLELNPSDSFRVEPWVGNSLLIETNVRLNNGKPSLMNHFLEKGRWALVENREGEQLSLVSQEMRRNVLTTSRGEVIEEVVVVFYVPENFEPNGQRNWVRKEE